MDGGPPRRQTSWMARRSYRPLKGIRILSFEVAFSLPAGTRALAELGAEVVRVAGPARPAGTYIAVIDGVFLSKPCIGIDLRTEAGRALARRLVTKADVVCSNFTPDVMKRFDLTPEDIVAIKPDLVVVQLTGYGTPGPWADFPAFGPSTEAAGGLNSLMGNEPDEPVRIGSGVFSDQLSGRLVALSILAALEHRRVTGEGQVIDFSMTEAVMALLGGFMAGAQVSGKLPPRPGNRDLAFAPQGLYPCAGDDEWVAVTVRDDAQWQALVALLGNDSLAEPGLASAQGRQAAHDHLDEAIARWTRQWDKDTAARLLQDIGVPAGPVRRPEDSLFDAHLAARDVFQLVRHGAPVLGYLAHPHLRHPWTAAGRPRAKLGEFRYTGADNERILRRWLGLRPAEVRRLANCGALLDDGELRVEDRPPAAGAGVDPDAGERLGLPRAIGWG